MSKKHEREEKLVDRLEEENRDLKRQVRSLQKHVKKLSRGYLNYLDQEETNKEEAMKDIQKSAKVAVKICWDCNQETYKEVIIANRRFRKCSECGRRGKTSVI